MKQNKTRILIIDANQDSGNYNNCLLKTLSSAELDVVYATCKIPYTTQDIPREIKKTFCFFKIASFVWKISKSLKIRKILKAIEYPLDLLYLCFYILINKVKVVHLMWTLVPAVDCFFLALLKCFGVKTVYTAHDPFPHDTHPNEHNYLSKVYEKADRIICLTEYTKKAIVDHYDVNENAIKIIPHGDYEYVFSRHGINNDLIEKIKFLAGTKKVFTFIGAIRPYKGVDVLIKAIKQIISQRDDVFFIIAGKVRPILEDEIADWLDGLGHDVLYADLRYLSTEDIKAYMDVSDVLVQPYISASQSGNTAMAYSYGVPVISTNVGGLGEMIVDGETGFIIEPSNVASLVEAINEIIQNDSFARLGDQARIYLRDKLGWPQIAQKTKDIYCDN